MALSVFVVLFGPVGEICTQTNASPGTLIFTCAMMLRNVYRFSIRLWPRNVNNGRKFSEFYHPYPQTRTTEHGQYLVQAIYDNEETTVASILDSGIDPNYRWKENLTPVMIAAENDKMAIMQILIKHGADINLQDDLGETALMKASRESRKDIVEELVKHGAQKDILNYENMTLEWMLSSLELRSRMLCMSPPAPPTTNLNFPP